MIYKKYEHPNFNLIGINNNKYKSCLIEVIFRKNIKEHDLIERSLLADTMCFSTKNYPQKKDLVIKCQDLYDLTINSSVSKLGNSLETSFCASFVCPKFINEENYLDNIVELLFEVIFNPNIINNSFDIRSFNITKKQLINDVVTIKEDPNKVAISGALNSSFKDSPTTYGMINEKEYLEDISPDRLYNIYQEMINKDLCDIFVIGDIDLETVNNLVSKYYINNVIKTQNIDLYIKNISAKRIKTTCHNGNFVQSNLVMIYNISDLEKKDLQITPYIFNNIFGNGSLNSKLFKYLREENSLCYGVSCMYLRFDGILIIKVSLAEENIKKAIILIKKALVEMTKGKFLDSELEDAKKSSVFSVKMAEDYIGGLLNNYIFNYYDDFPIPEDRIKIIKETKREDIIRFASSLKLNSIYILKEEQDETN